MKKMPLLLLAFLIVVFCSAQPGKFDRSFNGNGSVRYGYGTGRGLASYTSIAIQSDGKIVAAGYIQPGIFPNTEGGDFLISRYNTDGSFDSSFDQDGKASLEFDANAKVSSLAIQNDGKLLVAGAIQDRNRPDVDYFAMARFNSDGSLDNSFDGDGIIRFPQFAVRYERGQSYSLKLQSDGRIVVAGTSALKRFHINGSLDSSFGINGTINTDDIELTSIAVQPDDKIVGVGFTKLSGIKFRLLRYNPDGSFDNTFDGDGKVTTHQGHDAFSIAVQGDGKILAGGELRVNNIAHFALARFNADGSLDNSFGTDGTALSNFGRTDFNTSDFVYSIAIQSNGKIIQTGAGNNFTDMIFALARYHPDGSPDNTFDDDGKVTSTFGIKAGPFASVISNNRIYVAGFVAYCYRQCDYQDAIIAAYILESSTEGLNYKYYEGTWDALPEFNSLTPFQTGVSRNIDIGVRPQGRNDNYAFLWEGYINIPASGEYIFETVSDDGSKLYFDSFYSAGLAPLVNNDGLHAATPSTGSVYITTTGLHRIAITFFEKDGGESMQVFGHAPGKAREPIPNSAFTITAPPPDNGLNYRYYEGVWNTLPEFNSLTPVQSGVTPNIDIGIKPQGKNDHYAFVWEGYIRIPTQGQYTFETISDDGSRFYFNSFYSPTATPLVNNDGLHAARSATGNIDLSAGIYPVSITFFEKDGGEAMQLFWKGPGIVRELIPNSAFWHTLPPPAIGLNYRYYEGTWSVLPDFNSIAPIQTGVSANIDINVRPEGRNDHFAFVWEGHITIPTDGEYTFETISDDGSRLYFNSLYSSTATPLVDNDGLHAPRSATGLVTISAGSYPIAITFFERDGGESMQVYWTGPGIPRQLIPNSAFTSDRQPGKGINFKYYEGSWTSLPDFNTLTPAITGASANVNISVGLGRRDDFAFLWEGYITVPADGEYTFETISDDGSKLYFNSFYHYSFNALVNNDGLHAAASATGKVNISAGSYPIAITFFERDRAEMMEVYWTGPGIPRQLIPDSVFRQRRYVLPIASEVVSKNEARKAVSFGVERINVQRLYPNPFTDRLTIEFYNSAPMNDVSVGLYDLKGRLVYTHHAGKIPLGNTTLKINLSGLQLGDGIYIATLNVNGIPSKTVKLVKVSR